MLINLYYFQMSANLPANNREYKDLAYWNERFAVEENYEWLADYSDIRTLLLPILQKVGSKAKILQLGCGNSTLANALYIDGFEDVTSIDISDVCVEKNKKNFPHLKFIKMDMTTLEFADSTFDVVLEKATLDALLVDRISPWQQDSPGCQQVGLALQQVRRVLKPAGTFLSITFSQPHFLLPLLAAPGLGWSLAVQRFSTTGGVLDYFLVCCEAGDPGPGLQQWAVTSRPSIENNTEQCCSSEEESFILRLDTACLAGNSDSDSELDNSAASEP